MLSWSLLININTVNTMHSDVARCVASVAHIFKRFRQNQSSDIRWLRTASCNNTRERPEHIKKVPVGGRAYVQVKLELAGHNGLVLRVWRIVAPRSRKGEVLRKIHEWHQGIIKCWLRAGSLVWWPGLSSERTKLVISWQMLYEMKRTQQKEPLPSTPFLEQPWKWVL